ncbi:MAG TPA: hypothetical protein DER13_01275 [Clostridiales bacterium]|jgi:hypothetical protein|nr:hypothetical protein [Clostridiales bacterium]
MNFIFPQNYNFDNKLFGFISYSSLILNLIWACIIFFISNCFFNSLYIKISAIIILCFPLLLFTFIGVNNENIVYFLKYFLKYLLKNKLYLYK